MDGTDSTMAPDTNHQGILITLFALGHRIANQDGGIEGQLPALNTSTQTPGHGGENMSEYSRR